MWPPSVNCLPLTTVSTGVAAATEAAKLGWFASACKLETTMGFGRFARVFVAFFAGVGTGGPTTATADDSTQKPPSGQGPCAPVQPRTLTRTETMPGGATLKLYEGGGVSGAPSLFAQDDQCDPRLFVGAGGSGARIELIAPGFSLTRDAAWIDVLKVRPDAWLWPLGRTGAAALVVHEQFNGLLGGADAIMPYKAIVAIFTGTGWKAAETEDDELDFATDSAIEADSAHGRLVIRFNAPCITGGTTIAWGGGWVGGHQRPGQGAPYIGGGVACPEVPW